MKPSPSLLTVLLAVLLTGNVRAETASVELFDYPPGPLNQRSGGSGFEGPWRSAGRVEDNTLILDPKASQALRALQEARPLSPPVYAAATLHVQGSGHECSAPVSLRDETGAVLVSFAISKNSYTVTIPGATPKESVLKRFGRYTPSSDVRCVLKLERLQGRDVIASLWIDPDGPESGPVSGFVLGSLPTDKTVKQVELRLWGGDSATEARFRQLRIGRSWSEVAPAD